MIEWGKHTGSVLVIYDNPTTNYTVAEPKHKTPHLGAFSISGWLENSLEHCAHVIENHKDDDPGNYPRWPPPPWRFRSTDPDEFLDNG